MSIQPEWYCAIREPSCPAHACLCTLQAEPGQEFSMCLQEIALDSFLIIPMVSSSEKHCVNLEFSPEMLKSSAQRTG